MNPMNVYSSWFVCKKPSVDTNQTRNKWKHIIIIYDIFFSFGVEQIDQSTGLRIFQSASAVL